MKKFLISTLLLGVILMPQLVMAQDVNDICNSTFSWDPGCVNVNSFGSGGNAVINFALYALGLLRVIFWILAVAMILLSAFLFLTSGGDPAKTKKAKDYLKYTIIAIVVALIATSIPFLVKSIIGMGRGGVSSPPGGIDV